MAHLVIVGNGIAGITTARHVRKRSDMRITVISAETDHFFSRTALMYIYMGHMTFDHTKPYPDHFWPKNDIELIRAWVERVDTEAKAVHLADGRTIAYDTLVLATGSKSNKFGWPGQDLPGVQGLYAYPDVELLEENTRNCSRAVIVGGGLIGIELAEMLQSRGIAVTFLVREQFYWNNILPNDEARLICRHIREHGIDLRLGVNLKEILPGDDGRVRAVTIAETGEEIPCQVVGLTPGVHPNIDLAKASGIDTGRGILVNDYLETAIPDVYSAGDCAEIVVPDGERNRVEQLWYTGRMQGLALAATICGKRTPYERGIWFNSAKFIDIEYQTYGFVANQPRDGESSFYWEHPGKRHCLRIVYRDADRSVVGINVFGMRLRHPLCERWIRERRTVEHVIAHLSDAHFDPEFFRRHERDIIAAFNREHGTTIVPKRRSGFLQRFFGGPAAGQTSHLRDRGN